MRAHELTKLWWGHQAALSLTFDDGRPCHIETAIPELNKRKLCGTFFVITGENEYDTEFRANAWRDAQSLGHEIGSHTVRHKKAADTNYADASFEASVSKKQIRTQVGVAPESFCYPYTDVNEALLKAVKENYKQARAGRSARKDKCIIPGDEFNFHALPCHHINGQVHLGSIILEALDRSGWVTLMFHSIGRDEKEWDLVTQDQFAGMLDGLLVAERAGLWVAPFGVVAQNLREHLK